MGTLPAVSVVMSVYNGLPYLPAAIDSILAQTFGDFELIIIDDGSTDGSGAVIDSYSDRRIRVLTQSNLGLVASLNRGIREARGRYVARHDADDQSEPERFARQIAYLARHPGTAVVGSPMSVIGEDGRIKHRHAVLLGDPELRQELLVRSPFVHGSVMIDAAALDKSGGYDQSAWPAEDYDLWLRLSEQGRLANVPEYLYRYREHGAGISGQNAERQSVAVAVVREAAWLQRRRLISRRGIRLSTYRTVDMGDVLVRRILSNIKAANRQARAEQDTAFVIRNSRLLAASPLAYKKIAGHLKRKLRSRR
jgi:glycosyltransferase involved in cell wall biosynthesis